jgi:hypothetical protein
MNLKRFTSIWTIIMFATFLTVSYLPRTQTGKPIETANAHHFSVVWKGYNPDYYSNQTPDYYICINDLQASVLQMNIAFEIQNYENNSFWFMIDQYQTPPVGWNITSYLIGNIPVDGSTTFVYSNLTRVKPSSIPSGSMTETIALVVKAYYDSSYTQFYSQDNFTVQFHFIDRTSSAWTTLQYNNFDDGSNQGWSADWGGNVVSVPSPCRSWPNSFGTPGYSYYDKTFDTAGPFTEVYLIFALWHSGGDDMYILINGVTVFRLDLTNGASTWYQYIIPLPVSASVDVSIVFLSGSFLDDVYVIAK